jgi:hypothetical protein
VQTTTTGGLGKLRQRHRLACFRCPRCWRAYSEPILQKVWRDNPRRLLFPNRRGTLPRRRDNVVKNGLHPVLRKLGTPTKNAELHAFRHGLATELADKTHQSPCCKVKCGTPTFVRRWKYMHTLSRKPSVMRWKQFQLEHAPLLEQEQTAIS